MTITPSNLHLIILLILALPAILCLLLAFWGKLFECYSYFFVQDPIAKKKLEKFITPDYTDDEYDNFQFDYFYIGIVGFIFFIIPLIIYALVTYFFLSYFTDSYIGIFFTHAISIISIFFVLFCWVIIDENYYDLENFWENCIEKFKK